MTAIDEDDDRMQPEAKPFGALDMVDWEFKKKVFRDKYAGKGAKQKLAQIMMYYGIRYEKGMRVVDMRESVWGMIESSQRYTVPSESPAVASATIFTRFSVEFGDFAAQIPIIIQTATLKAAKVTTRSKRNQSGKNEKPTYFMQWAGKSYPIEEWNKLILSWEDNYPVTSKRKKGADEETADKQQESLKNYRIDCWNLLRPVWPTTAGMITRSQSNKNNIPEWFKTKYKLDIWGNVVTMDVSF